MTAKFSEVYPADPELSEDERKRYEETVNFPEGWQVAFNYEQTCLLRKRLNSLNASSRRIEKATYILLAVTLLLFLTTVVSIIGGKAP